MNTGWWEIDSRGANFSSTYYWAHRFPLTSTRFSLQSLETHSTLSLIRGRCKNLYHHAVLIKAFTSWLKLHRGLAISVPRSYDTSVYLIAYLNAVSNELWQALVFYLYVTPGSQLPISKPEVCHRSLFGGDSSLTFFLAFSRLVHHWDHGSFRWDHGFFFLVHRNETTDDFKYSVYDFKYSVFHSPNGEGRKLGN